MKIRFINDNNLILNQILKIEKLQTSCHPTVRCEMIYACNTGLSKIPMILQSHLYFRKQKYYLTLYSDPFVACSSVAFMFSFYLHILHKQIIKQNVPDTNPWNFMLYTSYHPREDIPYMIDLTFEYDNVKDVHVIESWTFNHSLTNLLDDMHKHEKYMSVFVAAYGCKAGWKNDNETVGGARAFSCGLIYDKRNVLLFLLDPNGMQVQGPIWWQKYTKVFYKNTGKEIPKFHMVENFFNNTILGVLIE